MSPVHFGVGCVQVISPSRRDQPLSQPVPPGLRILEVFPARRALCDLWAVQIIGYILALNWSMVWTRVGEYLRYSIERYRRYRRYTFL